MCVYMYECIFLFLWYLEPLHVSDNHSSTELLPQPIIIVSCPDFSYLHSKTFEWIFPNASLVSVDINDCKLYDNDEIKDFKMPIALNSISGNLQ